VTDLNWDGDINTTTIDEVVDDGTSEKTEREEST